MGIYANLLGWGMGVGNEDQWGQTQRAAALCPGSQAQAGASLPNSSPPVPRAGRAPVTAEESAGLCVRVPGLP